jgi:hypothetical protein
VQSDGVINSKDTLRNHAPLARPIATSLPKAG